MLGEKKRKREKDRKREREREREREFIHLLAQEQTVLDCLGSMRLIAED